MLSIQTLGNWQRTGKNFDCTIGAAISTPSLCVDRFHFCGITVRIAVCRPSCSCHTLSLLGCCSSPAALPTSDGTFLAASAEESDSRTLLVAVLGDDSGCTGGLVLTPEGLSAAASKGFVTVDPEGLSEAAPEDFSCSALGRLSAATVGRLAGASAACFEDGLNSGASERSSDLSPADFK